ncbi:octaprenyl-diphosphate synthase [Rhodothalassium salexigens DSM 2132]|uniref:Octaprenyl diphosphate synthase n=1 Tax=Rhodothalassium salexigens DSM 2132 TaxID=1188247 RepID=A0A4R2P7K1_RHOSA|nr:polyprenyl synthetase family protein [Rhodothalassium salexigens]MBB4212625.1 octaprenyl-diphosphate synthase [Rhodothalassium salexigens DSM 2132]TCP30777.1 octaprenyl-diphosphate synthase [Rhodothalassium salexigens DSM 2132]
MAESVPLSTDRAPAHHEALDRLQTLVADDLSRVNQIILDRMQSSIPLIPQLAGHLVSSGGKRLRPMLTLASAQMLAYDGRRHEGLAACVEFIHTATLLHDDVVDESDLRRGIESANAVWGNKPSVLVGDFLFSRSFELMVEDGSLDVLRILSRAAGIIAEGEVLQLTTSNDLGTTEEAYLEVIGAKTAALFAAACEVAAVVAGRPQAEWDALKAYGHNLGVAFQLVDDILDYSAKQAELGKSLGDDFREGKITLPVIIAHSRGTDEERAFWVRTLEDTEQVDGDLDHAIALVRRHEALAETAARAQSFGEAARRALDPFPDNEAKRLLLDIVDFCIDRVY